MYLRIIADIIHYPYMVEDLKKDNYNVTFPANLNDSHLAEWQMYPVQQTAKPNDYTKNIEEGIPSLIDGVYYQNWIQTNSTQSEIDLKIDYKWSELRDLRNQLLQECDWTQLADIPTETKELWQTYRQQLRDITTQSNPFSINWPVKP
jgi:hypothetical protein